MPTPGDDGSGTLVGIAWPDNPEGKVGLDQLFALTTTERQRYTVPGIRDQTSWKAGDPYKLFDPVDGKQSYTITHDDDNAQQAQAVAIVLAESNGWAHAECRDTLPNWYPPGYGGKRNTTKPCNVPGRGVDRGIAQFNSHAWPDISDADAFDPRKAMHWMYVKSDGFRSWGPWKGSQGLDPNGWELQQANAWIGNSLGEVHDPTPGPASVSDIPGVSTLAGWAAGLTKALSFLTSLAFWRRFGIGLLGALLVLVALKLTVSSSDAVKAAAVAA